MNIKSSTFKYGLYENKENLIPFSKINLNIKIINKFAKLNLLHIYKNPYDKNIDTTFFIPREIIHYFNSLQIEYNNNIYEGVIGNKSKTNLKKFENEDKYIDLLEFHYTRKRYLYFELNDIKPNQEIKIELNYIQTLDIENNKIYFIIPNIYIPQSSDKNSSYNYKYEINVSNTNSIKNIFCNYKQIKLNIINDKEFKLTYSNIRKNNEQYIKNFEITYEVESKKEPDLILLKHPLYKNDYVYYFSLNPKYLIEENNTNTNTEFVGNIIIYLMKDNYKKKFLIIKKSIICLLKSLPENGCSFNVIYDSPIFNECVPINENNINKAINNIENHCNESYYADPIKIEEAINFIRKDMSKKTRIFIIGDYYQDKINFVLEKVKDFIKYDFKIYNFVLQSYINKDLNQIKEISNITNGKMILYNIDELPVKLIKIYKEAITNNNYISDIKINTEPPDNNLIYINNDKNSINSNIEFMMTMNKNNQIKLEFTYEGKKYQYSYNINFENCEVDDMLHKILYYKYYNNINNFNIFNKSYTKNNIYGDIISKLNKYQILTKFNELFIELKDNYQKLEQKINKIRQTNIILKPKGNELTLIIRTLTGLKYEINCYSKYTIKEIKIIVEFLQDMFYKNALFVCNGKDLGTYSNTLEDYNIHDKNILNLVFRLRYTYIYKNNLDLYNNNDIYLLIKNQKSSGLWEANELNFKLIKVFGKSFNEFYDKYKDIYLKQFKKKYNNDILFTIAIIFFMNFYPYRKRYELIVQKSINYLKSNVEEYNEKSQNQIEILI